MCRPHQLLRDARLSIKFALHLRNKVQLANCDRFGPRTFSHHPPTGERIVYPGQAGRVSLVLRQFIIAREAGPRLKVVLIDRSPRRRAEFP